MIRPSGLFLRFFVLKGSLHEGKWPAAKRNETVGRLQTISEGTNERIQAVPARSDGRPCARIWVELGHANNLGNKSAKVHRQDRLHAPSGCSRARARLMSQGAFVPRAEVA